MTDEHMMLLRFSKDPAVFSTVDGLSQHLGRQLEAVGGRLVSLLVTPGDLGAVAHFRLDTVLLPYFHEYVEQTVGGATTTRAFSEQEVAAAAKRWAERIPPDDAKLGP